jgi:hypothetical protein
MESGKFWGLNVLWAGWGVAVISEYISLVIGIIGGITLIWMNVEQIITHRKNRKK